MSLLCWNCRGLGNPWTVRQLRKWSKCHSPDLVFISETMINKTEAESLKNKLGFTHSFGVSSVGRAGGLCVFWQGDLIEFTITSFNHHHICGDVHRGGKRWRFVGVYGWAKDDEKHHTWELIRHLSAESSVPILFGGDFNEIMAYSEVEGGATRVRRHLPMFREVVDVCELRDLGYKGQWWTWERGKNASTSIRERLDRYVASPRWCSFYPNALVENLLRYCSDHTPILLRLEEQQRKKKKKRKVFKFETAWLLDDTCEAVIKEAWDTSWGDQIQGRLMIVGRKLMDWSEEKFDGVGKQIDETEKALKALQMEDLTPANCEQRNSLEKRLDDLNNKQEAY